MARIRRKVNELDFARYIEKLEEFEFGVLPVYRGRNSRVVIISNLKRKKKGMDVLGRYNLRVTRKKLPCCTHSR